MKFTVCSYYKKNMSYTFDGHKPSLGSHPHLKACLFSSELTNYGKCPFAFMSWRTLKASQTINHNEKERQHFLFNNLFYCCNC